MNFLNEKLVAQTCRGLDFILAHKFDKPEYWFSEIPTNIDIIDAKELSNLTNECESKFNSVEKYFKTAPIEIFRLLGVYTFLRGYSSSHTASQYLILLLIAIGFFLIPQFTTLRDFKIFKISVEEYKHRINEVRILGKVRNYIEIQKIEYNQKIEENELNIELKISKINRKNSSLVDFVHSNFTNALTRIQGMVNNDFYVLNSKIVEVNNNVVQVCNKVDNLKTSAFTKIENIQRVQKDQKQNLDGFGQKIQNVNSKIDHISEKMDNEKSDALKQIINTKTSLEQMVHGIDTRVICVENHLKVPTKTRENYGAIPKALLKNLILKKAKYPKDQLILCDNSPEDEAKIELLSQNLGCSPKGIKDNLHKFNDENSLLGLNSSTLKSYLRYLDQLSEDNEYWDNELFRKKLQSLEEIINKNIRARHSKSIK